MSGKRRSPRSSRSGSLAGPLLVAALPAVVLGAMGFVYLRHEAVIADRTMREEGERFAMLAADRLSESYKAFLHSEEIALRAVTSESIPNRAVPSPASSKANSRAYRSFLDVESDPEALQTLIPTLRYRKTPAGLPLRSVARLQLARLHRESGNPEDAFAELQELLGEVVISDPSLVSESFLDAAEDIANSMNFGDLLDVSKWRTTLAAKQKTRDLLRRNREQILGQLNISRWFSDQGVSYHRTYHPDDRNKRFAISEREMEDLAGEALADLWPLAENGPRSLALRIVVDRHRIIPSPFNDFAIRQAHFEKRGFDVVESTGSGRELTASGLFGFHKGAIHVYIANQSHFERSVRQRILWLGAFLGAAWLCLLFGFWKTWRTLVFQNQLNERQSNLISSISHELRSPVAGIRLLAERLGATGPERDPRRADYIRMVGKETDRLSRLIDNILDTGRIAEGRNEYEFEWIDLAALLRDTAEHYAILAEEEDKRLLCRIGRDEEIAVLADPVALQQAVGNLVDNALKFSGPGGEVELDARIDGSGEGETATILVKDRGCGIAAEEIPKIFDLFYRSGAELRRETTGTGLGLFLVKTIAEAHGGRVEVDSEPGTGSEFRLVLPGEARGQKSKVGSQKEEIIDRSESRNPSIENPSTS